jgi:hypothetical protein
MMGAHQRTALWARDEMRRSQVLMTAAIAGTVAGNFSFR